MDLRDYLDAISPEERAAFANGPHAQIMARGRPFTDLGADLVYRPMAPSPSLTTSGTPMVYGGPAPTATVMPTTTAPIAVGEWRRAVSTAALMLATSVANVLRMYPTSPVHSLIVPLRTFGLQVLDTSRTVEWARATLNGFATQIAGVTYGGTDAMRMGLNALIAMIPPSTSTGGGGGGGLYPTFPSGGGGGIGPSTGGPDTPPPSGSGGGSTSPPPTTSGCPTNASYNAAAGGCVCDPGFGPDAAMTSCVAVSSGGGYTPPRPTPSSSGGGSGGMGWLLLLGGAALLYKAAK